MSGDNWLNAWQEDQMWKQGIKIFSKCTWDPINITKDEEMTYFNNKRRSVVQNQYDLYFSFSKPGPLWDLRKKKDNCQFQQDIRENIYHQELKKAVPATNHLNYGRRSQYERPGFQFNRIAQIPSFYRRAGPFPVIEKVVSSGVYSVPALQ